MATNHTPGPWTYRKADKHFHIEASAPGHGSAVAEVRYSGNGDTGWTSETNARLIAAAPELLVALEAMVKEYGSGELDPDISGHRVALQARAAIAKATGNA